VPYVGIEARGDRWRVRWRERGEGGGWRWRSVTVSDKATARALAGDCTRALEREGVWTPPSRREPTAGEVATLGAVWAGYLRHRAARGAARSSLAAWLSMGTRIQRDLRDLLGESGDPPCSALSVEVVTRLLLAWEAEGLSESRRYALASMLARVWSWAADDPGSWPGVPSPPRDRSYLVPPAPTRAPPPLAPTWAECDAAIRACPPRLAEVAVCLRGTGLRLGQVLDLRAGDLESGPGGLGLRVRHGKSKGERADRRLVPLAPHVAGLLGRLADGLDAADPLWPSDQPHRDTLSRQSASARLRGAWRVAVQLGEVREAVIWPPSHGRARPAHAFRAAFMAGLSAAGIGDDLIGELVGHRPRSVMRRHYARLEDTSWPALRRAVEVVPPPRGWVVRLGEGHG